MNQVLSFLDDLEALYTEAAAIDSKPNLTKADELRHARILSQVSAIKSGYSLEQIRKAETDRLLTELGKPTIESASAYLPAIRNKQFVSEWRTFMADKTHGAELRGTNNSAGSASLAYTAEGAGGVLVPFGFDARQNVLMSKFAYDQIVTAPYVTEFPTPTGNPMTTPVIDDFSTANSPLSRGASYILAENTLDVAAPFTLAQQAWAEAPKWSSGAFLISMELFQDAVYGTETIAGLIEAVIARRHAVGLGAAMISGSGLSGGLTANLPTGNTITSAASSLALADFINLYAQLSPMYRANAVWYMADATRLKLHALVETSARPSVDLPTSLFGRPICICNSMNGPSAGSAAAVVLADVTYLQKRNAGTSLLKYLQAPGAVEAGIIKFKGLLRADFAPVLYGSAVPPVAVLNIHS